MTIARFSLADASIAEVILNGGKKAPPKRTSTVMADPKLVPEPR